MTAAHRRHDMSDAVWERLKPHLPGGEGKQGRPAHDNRRFIDAVCWILRTGSPWRDLPPDYGDWKNTHRRFCRWRDRGVWADLLEAVMEDPDFEWLMVDASYIKAHPHSAGARGEISPSPAQKGLNSKLHMATDSHGMPVRLAVTEGTVADSSQALPLIEGIEAEYLLADKAYDTNEIIAAARKLGMEPVIPPKRTGGKSGLRPSAVQAASFGGERILEFKQWRGVATRYAKRTASYMAICQLRAVMIWSKLF